MAEAFVRTIKRDYVRVSPCPNAETVMFQLPSWITHYNEVHPHKALGYRSPREFIAARENPLPCPLIRGLQQCKCRHSTRLKLGRLCVEKIPRVDRRYDLDTFVAEKLINKAILAAQSSKRKRP